jgi:hypothetical protein
MKITVLYYPSEICTMYTLYPLLKGKYRGLFDFTQNLEKVFKYKSNKIICVFRFFRWGYSDDDTASYFKRLRDHYEKIIYFEDTPDPRKIMVNAIDYADIYYKKSLLRDMSLYKKEYYSETVFGDYYHNAYGIQDDKSLISRPLREDQIKKLRLAWNLGIGQYPRTRIRQVLCKRIEKLELIDLFPLFLGHPKNYHIKKDKPNLICPMRFRGGVESKAIDYQRVFFSEIAKKKQDLFMFGKVSLAHYNKEIRGAKITFSPFGLGEVCFRDFEAIINYSLLLKPDMDHLITWPDVYKKDETYIPLKWDGSDFLEKIEYWLRADIGEITDHAYDIYLSAFNQHSQRLESILDQIYAT